jgi:hypothetical protein
MYFPDLGSETEIADAPFVRAIGWLAPESPYPRGVVSPDCLARIADFCALCTESAIALGWPFAAGPHHCEFCGEAAAAGNLGVPASDLLYVCPEMLAHYVRDHSYLPPQEFIDAVMQAPLPGSPEYERAVEKFRPPRRRR